MKMEITMTIKITGDFEHDETYASVADGLQDALDVGGVAEVLKLLSESDDIQKISCDKVEQKFL